MARAGAADTDDGPKVTALRHVGPATAAVIEQCPFDTADILAGQVSHRDLIDAGVNPGVAERLRREYGLLWAFRWHPGEVDLSRRAAALSEAGTAEREWIAASGAEWQDRSYEASTHAPDAERRAEIGGEWAAWPEPADEDDAETALAAALGGARPVACPRCSGELSRYTLGEQASILCDDCGYAGVPVAHVDDAWRKAVDRIVRGQATSRPE